MTSQDPKKPDEIKTETGKKLEETIEKLKNSENVDTIVNYAQSHVFDTVAYILLVLGIIWSFFHPLYGGLIVGLVAGWYFSQEIFGKVKGFQDYIDQYGTEKAIVLGALLIALLFQAPGVVIGMMLTALIRGVLSTKSHS